MSSVVIIAGGDFPKKEYPRLLVREADIIVCCDGSALKAFLRNRKSIFGNETRLPDAVVGDLDSLSGSLSGEYKDLLVRVAQQDDNDLAKAFHHVVEKYPDVDRITFLAATGKREDHTIGNLGQLMEFARFLDSSGRDISLEAISDHSTIIPITDSCELFVGEGRSVSLFSPDNTLNIKSEGLVWQTGGVVFDNWWKASLNRASADLVRLRFSHRSIALLILD